MLFSSMIFLWCFLPMVLLLYFLLDKKFKNLLLVAASLIFYAWGEPQYIWLMLFSVLMNFVLGILVDRFREKAGKLIIFATVLLNLGLLGYFKYTNFFVISICSFFPNYFEDFKWIVLPIGISFYTFQAMSYVIDVYKGTCQVQKNPLRLGLFITFFPQLIAGPIVKYHEIAPQLETRTISISDFAYGIRRFILGLSKKVLIANTLAVTADHIFTTQLDALGTSAVWLGAICYTFQIYYDFSGYSDMAIGLGRMFGFHFPENFRYPYLTKSIKEFWTRWHISLSTWFKEYLYIPLGGNRKGELRTWINLCIVFLATGIWHGANWTFVFWGIYHGAFILIERAFLKKYLDKDKFAPLAHIYAMLVVICGWVLFRADNASQAWSLLKKMFVYQSGTYPISAATDLRIWVILIAAVIFCGPIQTIFPNFRDTLFDDTRIRIWEIAVLPLLLVLCFVFLIANTYNPFIYFRF